MRSMLEPGSKSVHIKTFGCQMNVYDSNRMLSLLTEKGFSEAPDMSSADIIILNTCSVRGKAEHKVLSLLGQLKPLKKQFPDKVIGVSGCVGQRMGKELLKKVPHLDFVFGPDSVERVDKLVESVLGEGRRIVSTDFDPRERQYSQPVNVYRSHPSELLTIVKGCDQFCSYCIVPFVRGREKSRPIPEILDDVKRLVDTGTKEVIFLGQNINTYGKGTPYTLAALIEQAHRIEGLERIRYLTSHPKFLSEDLIRQFGELEKLCPHLHLPFQSGSNRILKAMTRLYTKEELLKKAEHLRKCNPGVTLSTDIIVGFPGETEDEFQETLEVARLVNFSQAFLFKYSPRPGTRAYTLYKDDEVSEHIKEKRLAVAQDIVFSSIEKENKALVGTKTSVLMESIDKKKRHYSGRDPHGRLVHVMDAIEDSVGNILEVEITEGNTSNLRGYHLGIPKTNRGLKNDP